MTEKHSSLDVNNRDNAEWERPFREPNITIESPRELKEITQKLSEQDTQIQQILTTLQQIESKLDKNMELIDIKKELLEANLNIAHLFEAILLRSKGG